MNFEQCLRLVLEVEKGFVSHALDRGGPTNLGITIGTLSAHLGRPASVQDIQALTPEAVAPIYRQRYWDLAKLDEWPEVLRYPAFNQIILRGLVPTVKSIQFALKQDPDGRIGPKTLAAMKARDPRILTFDFLRETQTAYIKICQSDPSQLVFLAGWNNRVWELLAQVLR